MRVKTARYDVFALEHELRDAAERADRFDPAADRRGGELGAGEQGTARDAIEACVAGVGAPGSRSSSVAVATSTGERAAARAS